MRLKPSGFPLMVLTLGASLLACRPSDTEVYGKLNAARNAACSRAAQLHARRDSLSVETDADWNRAEARVPTNQGDRRAPQDVRRMSSKQYSEALDSSFARTRRALTSQESTAIAHRTAISDTLADSILLADRRCRSATLTLRSWLDSGAAVPRR